MFRIVTQETAHPPKNSVTRVLREGIIVWLANHTVLIAKDGTERPIDDSAAPIKDQSGEIKGVVMAFRDVTERRRAENALHEANIRLKEREATRPNRRTGPSQCQVSSYVRQGLFGGNV